MITFDVATAAEMLVGLRTMIDVDGTAGYVQLYAGSRPATGAAPTGSTLVASCPLAYPCGTIDGAGALALAIGGVGLVLVGSTPTWARIRSAGGAFVADCNCRLIGATPSADPEEIVIDAPGLVPGANITVAGGTISAPT